MRSSVIYTKLLGPDPTVSFLHPHATLYNPQKVKPVQRLDPIPGLGPLCSQYVLFPFPHFLHLVILHITGSSLSEDFKCRWGKKPQLLICTPEVSHVCQLYYRVHKNNNALPIFIIPSIAFAILITCCQGDY